MEVSNCVFKQKENTVKLADGSSLMTVEFSHHNNNDDEVNGIHYVSQKSLPVQPHQFGQFTLTLIPKEV